LDSLLDPKSHMLAVKFEKNLKAGKEEAEQRLEKN
jgi:hypothetical protein